MATPLGTTGSPPSLGANVAVAVTSSDRAGVPALARTFEKAMA